MAVPAYPTVGSFPLDSVENLPLVTVAHQGEHWSDRVASGTVSPGVCVVPVAGQDRYTVEQASGAEASALASQAGIALRPVDIPDVNTGPNALGPNEVRNQDMADGDWVHVYLSGVFHITRFVAAAYKPGDLIGWDLNGTPQTGVEGVGAWSLNASADLPSIFEVQEFRPLPGETTRGLLTVRSLRGQF